MYVVKLGPEGVKVFGADPGLVVTNLMDRENQRSRGGVEGHVGGERIAGVVKGERDSRGIRMLEGFVVFTGFRIGEVGCRGAAGEDERKRWLLSFQGDWKPSRKY